MFPGKILSLIMHPYVQANYLIDIFGLAFDDSQVPIKIITGRIYLIGEIYISIIL